MKTAKRTQQTANARAGVSSGVLRLLRDEESLAHAVAKLRALDRDCIGRMLETAGPPPLRRREPGLTGLIRIVISQQVSTASANAIHARFAARFGDANHRELLAASDLDLQSCGLSRPKIATVRSLCAALDEQRLNLDRLASLPPEEARAALTQVKGVGPWSADVYLLFCIGHPDIWPAGDLALQEGVRLALDLPERPAAARLEQISTRWRPWRAAAARLVWAYYGAIRAARSGPASDVPPPARKRRPD